MPEFNPPRSEPTLNPNALSTLGLCAFSTATMRSYDYQHPVRTYKSTDPSHGGDILESPSQSLTSHQGLVVSRHRSSNRVTVTSARNLNSLSRLEACTATTNAHGVITRDGWGEAINPSYTPDGQCVSPLLPYSRGERVWIEESLLPTDENHMIPVVTLDSGKFFRLSINHICLVADMKKAADPGCAPQYATTAGPVHSVVVDGEAWKIQGYFEHSTRGPVLSWAKWRSGCSVIGGFAGFRPLGDENERRRVFEGEWNSLWLESASWLGQGSSSLRSQLDLDQLVSPEPRPNEHLHTPRSRLSKPNLSKRALRTANVPYRPLKRWVQDEEEEIASSDRCARRHMQPCSTQDTSRREPVVTDSNPEGLAMGNNIAASATGYDFNGAAVETWHSSAEGDSMPLVLNLNICLDLNNRKSNQPPLLAADEDYDML